MRGVAGIGRLVCGRACMAGSETLSYVFIGSGRVGMILGSCKVDLRSLYSL